MAYDLDGNFLRRENSGKGKSIKKLKNSSYILDVDFGAADKSEKKNFNRFQLYHPDGVLKKESILFNKKLLGRSFHTGYGHESFYDYNGETIVIFSLNDTIYHFNETANELAPILFFDLSVKRPSYNDDEKSIEKALKEKDIKSSLYGFQQIGTYLYLSLYYRDRNWSLILDGNQSLIHSGVLPSDVNDLPMMPIPYVTDKTSDYLLGLLFSSSIPFFYQRNIDKGISNQIIEELNQITHSEDNPILMFYTIN